LTTYWYYIPFSDLATPANVLVQTSDPSSDLSVELLSTNISSSRQVLEYLEAIAQFIESKGLEAGFPGDMPNP
jgi:hypothetical protein